MRARSHRFPVLLLAITVLGCADPVGPTSGSEENENRRTRPNGESAAVTPVDGSADQGAPVAGRLALGCDLEIEVLYVYHPEGRADTIAFRGRAAEPGVD